MEFKLQEMMKQIETKKTELLEENDLIHQLNQSNEICQHKAHTL